MAELWTTIKVLDWTARRFAQEGILSARLDAELLLACSLKTTRIKLYTGFDQPLGPDELSAYRDLVRRRLAGEPVAYLTGEREFWSLPLQVDARVLIPRRDTETLVEVALEHARSLVGREAPLRIADVATGSGAVALALKKELPGAVVLATDRSLAALAVARTNAARLALPLLFVAGDLAAPLGEGFDLVVSNPPYVPTAEIASLSREVRCEPGLALDGGADGLDLVRRLVPEAALALRPGGLLAVEHALDQGDRVAALFAAAGLAGVRTVKDLAGAPRVTAGVLRSER